MRAPTAADADTIVKLADNPEVSRWLSRMPCPYTRADALEWIASVTAPGASECAFLVTLEASGEVIGACGIDDAPDCELPQIGYWIGQPHWGNGYAPEAAQALIDHAFTTTPLVAIGAGCRVANVASAPGHREMRLPVCRPRHDRFAFRGRGGADLLVPPDPAHLGKPEIVGGGVNPTTIRPGRLIRLSTLTDAPGRDHTKRA